MSASGDPGLDPRLVRMISGSLATLTHVSRCSSRSACRIAGGACMRWRRHGSCCHSPTPAWDRECRRCLMSFHSSRMSPISKWRSKWWNAELMSRNSTAPGSPRASQMRRCSRVACEPYCTCCLLKPPSCIGCLCCSAHSMVRCRSQACKGLAGTFCTRIPR